MSHEAYMHCSFCLRQSVDVVILVAGPCGNICDGCIDKAVEDIRNKTKRTLLDKPSDNVR